MKLKWKAKIVLCGMLVVFAGLSLMTVLCDLGVMRVSAAEEPSYVLREQDGFVSVFYPPEDTEPAMITDIRVADLPAGDRWDLAQGIGAADYDEMIALLEGLSS